MTLILRLAAFSILLVDPSDECSIEASAFFPYEGSTYMLALPLPDTFPAGNGPIKETASSGRGRWPPGGEQIFGQRFQLQRHGGAAEEALDSIFVSTGRRDIVLVFWGYDGECNPSKWKGSSRWAPLGTPLFVLGDIRPRTQWAHGRPTFDVLWAHNMVYGPPLVIKDLSPDDVFTLVDNLPKPCAWHTQADEANRTLALVKHTHRDLVKYRTAQIIFSRHDRWAQEAGWHDLDPSLLAACEQSGT